MTDDIHYTDYTQTDQADKTNQAEQATEQKVNPRRKTPYTPEDVLAIIEERKSVSPSELIEHFYGSNIEPKHRHAMGRTLKTLQNRGLAHGTGGPRNRQYKPGPGKGTKSTPRRTTTPKAKQNDLALGDLMEYVGESSKGNVVRTIEGNRLYLVTPL